MKPVRTLLVDDEELARARLRQLLAAEADFEIVGECADGPSTLEALEHLAPEFVLLDVQMPGMDGFEVLASAREPLPVTVFVTAHDRYALQAFEVHALDYLLKPCDRARFHDCLARARGAVERRRLGLGDENLLALAARLRAERPERLVVKGFGRVSFVPVEEIDWIEACGNHVRLHGRGGTHLLRQTLAGIAAELGAERFVRIHRSQLVRLDRIARLERRAHGDAELVLRDGTHLAVSRTYRAAVLAALEHGK